MSVLIRTLTPDHAPPYRELRLRALLEHPEAFATSYSEELERSTIEVVTRLVSGPEQVTLGAFDDGPLVGMVTLVRSPRIKVRHRAGFAGMYVVPEARGQSVGRQLLERGLEIAKQWGVTDLSLGVTVGNDDARHLYESMGFTGCGIEPRYLCIDGRFHDMETMVLRLDEV